MCLNNVHKRHSTAAFIEMYDKGIKESTTFLRNIFDDEILKTAERRRKFAATTTKKNWTREKKSREFSQQKKIREETSILEHEEHNLCCIFFYIPNIYARYLHPFVSRLSTILYLTTTSSSGHEAEWMREKNLCGKKHKTIFFRFAVFSTIGSRPVRENILLAVVCFLSFFREYKKFSYLRKRFYKQNK